MFDINDEKSELMAEVLGNKTCKKILALLAEKEITETDIARELKIPLNTVDYNVKKLLSAGLVEEAKDFFWSVKGKKIKTFRVANKKIIISPKTSFKGILGSVLIGGLVLSVIKIYSNVISAGKSFNNINVETPVFEKAQDLASSVQSVGEERIAETFNVMSISVWSSVGIWFLAGALVGLIGFLIYRYFKNRNVKGGLRKL